MKHRMHQSWIGMSMVRHCSVFILAVMLLWPGFSNTAPLDRPQVITHPADPAVDQQESKSTIDVFYLTNRNRYPGKPGVDAYNGERGEAHFGRCKVEFTPIPVIKQFAERVPFYLKRETHQVSLAEQTEPAEFWQALIAAAGRTSSGSVVLFVHGYNYGFERTCRMAAELQRSLQDKATVLMFSWPSNGSASDYIRDQADIEWSVPLLATSIGQLSDHIGMENTQVVAHSLGARGVIFALQRLATERVARPVISRLVLLAPDFDAQAFADLLPGLKPLVGGITLYASSNDAPLKLSQQLSGYPRLGEAGEYLTVIEGVETIDVSSSGRYQFTGHEYFNYHPWVSADLMTLLSTGADAEQRIRLRVNKRNGVRYWEFKDGGREGE